MTGFTATLGIISLLGFINLSAANKDSCDLYAAVGQNFTLPFVYEGLANSHVLRWIHDKTIIFYRQHGRVSVGKPADISATGSLLLKNLPFSSTGTYQATVLHPNGTLAKTWTGRLCMMYKVPKPLLNYACDFNIGAINLNCIVANPQGLVFSWTLDKKTLPSETKQTLRISLSQLKGERSFTCSVANTVSTESSDTVRPSCKSPPAPEPLCFAPRTVWATLAGGAGLILILLIAIIALCCCRRCNKTQMRDKGELRMLSLSKREPDSISPEYETMHPTDTSPPPSPQPSPRACYHNVSQPEAPAESRNPQPCTAAEGQRPSPVPKPRTRNPQTTNT